MSIFQGPPWVLPLLRRQKWRNFVTIGGSRCRKSSSIPSSELASAAYLWTAFLTAVESCRSPGTIPFMNIESYRIYALPCNNYTHNHPHRNVFRFDSATPSFLPAVDANETTKNHGIYTLIVLARYWNNDLVEETSLLQQMSKLCSSRVISYVPSILPNLLCTNMRFWLQSTIFWNITENLYVEFCRKFWKD